MRKYKKVASYVLTMILASSLAGMPVKANGITTKE